MIAVRLPSARMDGAPQGSRASPRILLVPGFVADTYCEIERSYVELCARAAGEVEFLWLVPKIDGSYENFAKPESRGVVREPLYVSYLREEGIPYVIGKISKYNAVANLRLFIRLFREHHIDAVYTHFGYERFWATFCAKLLGKVTIWNEHWYSLGMRYAAAKKWFYRVFVDEFIAVSTFISRTLPAGASVHTIRNGIWPAVRQPVDRQVRADLRLKLGIAADSTVLLMVAAFQPQKRHSIALDICARLLRQRSDLTFVFLGEGPTRKAFLDAANDCGLAAHILAPGYVQNVDDYYTAADISMLTSCDEGFGYVVLEAMQHGLPVVVYDTGAPAETVRHAETGFVIRDGDREGFVSVLLRLIENEELRREMGGRARRSVREEYNREAWINTLNTALRDIVVRRRRSPEKTGARA